MVKKPHVLLDASIVRREQGGARTYALGLAHAIAQHSRVKLSIVGHPGVGFEECGAHAFHQIASDTGGAGRRALWRETSLRALVRKIGADVLLVPAHETPLRSLGVPTVMVILDVGPLVAPALYGFQRWLRYRMILPWSCRHAAHVVCISHSTLLDVHATLGVSSARMSAIGVGPQPFISIPPTDAAVSAPSFLYVGSALRHKNLGTLLSAFSHDDGAVPPGRLDIVGPFYTDGERATFDRELAASGARDVVRHHGFVSRETLADLYSRATAIVLPSLHEGFGMPILEAALAGKPIVASDIPAVREVAANGALLVARPLDADAWRMALAEVARDADLRRELVDHGRERLRHWSWEEIGESWGVLLAGVHGGRS